LAQLIERSTRVQGPAAEAYVAGCGVRIRSRPAEIVAKLEKRYLDALTASGAAVGSTATFPGGHLDGAVGRRRRDGVLPRGQRGLRAGERGGLRHPADHRERRRALVLAVLVGDDSKRALGELLGPARTNGGGLAEGMASLPMSTLARLNTRLLKHAVKRYTVKRGALMLGKMLPVGIGAAIGGAGNAWWPRRSSATPTARSVPAHAVAGNPAPVAVRPRGRVAACENRVPRLSGEVSLANCRRSASLYGAETFSDRRGCEVPRRSGCRKSPASRNDACRTLNDKGIEANSGREQRKFTIRSERVAGRGDVPQVPR